MKKYRFLILLTLLTPLILSLGCDTELSPPDTHPIACYAATYGSGIYKSTNGGESWYPIDPDNKDINAYFKRLYLDPERNKLYMATSGEGLYVINPFNEAMDKCKRFIEDDITSIAFYNTSSVKPESSAIIIGMSSKGIFEGNENLEEWRTKNQRLIYNDVNIILSCEGFLFAGTIKDLFLWDQSILEWKPSSDGIRNKNIISLGADPEGEYLLAGSGAYSDHRGWFEKIPCLYKSTDQGRSWMKSDNNIPDGTLVYSITVNPEKPQRIYLGTSDGVYFSSDEGQTWNKEQAMPKGLRVFDIKIARMGNGTDVIYAAGSNGVYMTTDDKKTSWQNKSYGLAKTAVTSIVLLAER